MQPTTTSPGKPASRNFSHPYRQRAATFSHQHNQNSLLMVSNDSRHMLPLPSTIFSHSVSNIHSETNSSAGFNFSYRPLRRSGTAHGACTSYSVPDLTLTALPQPPLSPLLHHSQGLPAINIDPPSLRKLIKSPPRSPTKSTKGSGWRRVGRKIKRAFKFCRQKKKNSGHSEEGKKMMVIGSPTDFQHVETHGVGPLRPSEPYNSRAMTPGRLRVEPSDGELGGGAKVARLGRLDVEGTAVEDDELSEWEDYEGDTRLFFQQGSTRKRN